MSAGGATLWQPRSACDTDCLSPGDGVVPAPLATLRAFGLLGVLLAGALLVPVLAVLRGAARAVVVRTLARAALAALGVRITVRGRAPRRAGLLVANHVSWLDVVALTAATPARLVAKHDVRGWPGVGALAAACGTIFVDRSRPRRLPHTVAQVAASLRAGSSVAVFPEGTTYCGAAQGPFRPAMFQAAVDAGAPVVPLSVSYRAGGEDTRAVAFVGEDTLWESVRRIAAVGDLTVSVVISPALHPAPAADRRALARAAESTIRLGVRRAPAPGSPPDRGPASGLGSPHDLDLAA